VPYVRKRSRRARKQNEGENRFMARCDHDRRFQNRTEKLKIRR
jgi:hypothetical protein